MPLHPLLSPAPPSSRWHLPQDLRRRRPLRRLPGLQRLERSSSSPVRVFFSSSVVVKLILPCRREHVRLPVHLRWHRRLPCHPQYRSRDPSLPLSPTQVLAPGLCLKQREGQRNHHDDTLYPPTALHRRSCFPRFRRLGWKVCRSTSRRRLDLVSLPPHRRHFSRQHRVLSRKSLVLVVLLSMQADLCWKSGGSALGRWKERHRQGILRTHRTHRSHQLPYPLRSCWSQ